ncbi:amino acid permease [Pediococcus acidilactici]|uniref:amino acid permease n=1 Tax=Pediococcus acidilactici TaxID=1254 RepID=UPI00071AF6DF|nr:amino acid permease [Pediococcus acidilactici]KSV56612.1 amino acid permease [Pediococcus acidilactici]
MQLKHNIFRKESLANYLKVDSQFEKTLGAKDLLALGIGAVIGTGIFILPGTVAALKAGPSITLSFVIAALVCALAGMCYAEFAASIPVAGSAYSYGTIIYGELLGWLLGWALILEYVLAVAAVSTGWSAYFGSLVKGFGGHLPAAIAGPFDPQHGTYINLFAVIIVLLIGFLLNRGFKSSIRINNLMVFVKIAIILIFIGVGIFYVKPSNWQPYFPFGIHGTLAGASTVFFAYLGFDTVSASAAEVKNPAKNMPIGIIGTLIVATIFYVAVAVVLTGMVPYNELNVANPVSFALQLVHQNWIAGLLSVGALAGMTTMMISMIYGSSRLVYATGRDGLLPRLLGQLEGPHRSPKNALIVVTIFIALLGGFVPLDQLTNLVNMGTLFAFGLISLGVIPLRRRTDIPGNGFKAPGYPVIPIISVIACVYLISTLSLETWIGSAIWFAIGLIIYFSYGMRHSKLAE